MKPAPDMKKDPEYTKVKAWGWATLTILILGILISAASSNFMISQFWMMGVFVAFIVTSVKYARLRKKYLHAA